MTAISFLAGCLAMLLLAAIAAGVTIAIERALRRWEQRRWTPARLNPVTWHRADGVELDERGSVKRWRNEGSGGDLTQENVYERPEVRRWNE